MLRFVSVSLWLLPPPINAVAYWVPLVAWNCICSPVGAVPGRNKIFPCAPISLSLLVLATAELGRFMLFVLVSLRPLLLLSVAFRRLFPGTKCAVLGLGFVKLEFENLTAPFLPFVD